MRKNSTFIRTPENMTVDSIAAGKDLAARADKALKEWFNEVIEPCIQSEYVAAYTRSFMDYETFRKRDEDYKLLYGNGELMPKAGHHDIDSCEKLLECLTDSNTPPLKRTAVHQEREKIRAYVESILQETITYHEYENCKDDGLRLALERSLDGLRAEISEALYEDLFRPRRSHGKTMMDLLKESLESEFRVVDLASQKATTKQNVSNKLGRAKDRLRENKESLTESISTPKLGDLITVGSKAESISYQRIYLTLLSNTTDEFYELLYSRYPAQCEIQLTEVYDDVV